MAANLLFGRGDVKTVVELVRAHDVDVLNLLELTVECTEELARAGLFDVLPHQFLRPGPGGEGSAVLSRHPLTELALVDSTRLAQPSARIDVGGIPVEVVAVHPVPPTQSAPVWQAELGLLPTPVPAGPLRILAGDFNATADHAAFRRLLRAGYVDAAQRRGSGLLPTWRLGRFPLVTLDHILVDSRADVVSFRVLDVPGSDHKAVYADIVLRQRDHRREPTWELGR
jgi:endonuclease/exonuclease/phosphatase family metal-dependent hydrolase